MATGIYKLQGQHKQLRRVLQLLQGILKSRRIKQRCGRTAEFVHVQDRGGNSDCRMQASSVVQRCVLFGCPGLIAGFALEYAQGRKSQTSIPTHTHTHNTNEQPTTGSTAAGARFSKLESAKLSSDSNLRKLCMALFRCRNRWRCTTVGHDEPHAFGRAISGRRFPARKQQAHFRIRRPDDRDDSAS